jgi:hypothetical protein
MDKRHCGARDSSLIERNMRGYAAIVGVFRQKRGFLPDQAYPRFKGAKDCRNCPRLDSAFTGLGSDGVNRVEQRLADSA